MVGSGELDRVELLRGYLVRKMSKSPLHSAIVHFLAELLTTFCRDRGLVVYKEEPITLSDSEPEPDIAVVKGKREDYFHAHPSCAELVIEVAIASVAKDRAKAEIYAEAEIAEYWLVLPETREIVVYRDPAAGVYSTISVFGESETVPSTSIRGFEVRLADLLPETSA